MDLYFVKNKIDYTYNFKINTDSNGAPVYFPINSELEFDLLVNEFREHKKDILMTGDILARSLQDMNEEQLNNFIDER